MNPQDNQNMERRLQEIEAELNNDKRLSSVETEPGQPLQRHRNDESSLRLLVNQVVNWFNSLPTLAKVAVAIITVTLAFSLLRSVLQLVASLLSLGVLGVILYLVYKFVIAPQPPR
jgi:hypothetical protein